MSPAKTAVAAAEPPEPQPELVPERTAPEQAAAEPVPAAADPAADLQPWEIRQREQEAEYGVWIAAERIFEGSALAYNAGDPVPASNVAALGYADAGLVRRRTPDDPVQR